MSTSGGGGGGRGEGGGGGSGGGGGGGEAGGLIGWTFLHIKTSSTTTFTNTDTTTTTTEGHADLKSAIHEDDVGVLDALQDLALPAAQQVRFTVYGLRFTVYGLMAGSA